jgi:rhodanese-related sulfurtransferase
MGKGKATGKRFFIAFGALALVLSCRSHAAAAEGAVSPKEAVTWIQEKKDLQLIDVRTAAEYADGHLAKAKLIPLQELEKRLTEIDEGKPILLYCRSGHRSGNALKILHGKGYTQAKHMEGGLNAWKAAGLPITK